MIKEGDTLKIKNTLLFAEFGYAQTNRVAVRIPPFSIKDGHVTTIADYEITYSKEILRKYRDDWFNIILLQRLGTYR